MKEKYEFHNGDYVETLDGRIGYITYLTDDFFMTCLNDIPMAKHSYYLKDDLSKTYKRIGKYDFTKDKNKVEILESKIDWNFDKKDERTFRHNIRLGLFELNKKVNEIVEVLNNK